MRITRIYHPSTLEPDQEIALESQAATHLTRVLRIQAGAELVLFNGDGNEYRAVISRTHRNQAWARIIEKQAIDHESPLDIRLCQGISKAEHMDYTLQKAVELGVTSISPLLTEHGSVQLKSDRLEKKLKHWQGIVSSACEQCGRNRVPVIEMPEKFEQWIAGIDNAALKLTLEPNATAKLGSFSPGQQGIMLLIGPEGGLSQNEISLSHQHGFSSIRLGPRILRTETAAITALSIIQNLWGDLG